MQRKSIKIDNITDQSKLDSLETIKKTDKVQNEPISKIYFQIFLEIYVCEFRSILFLACFIIMIVEWKQNIDCIDYKLSWKRINVVASGLQVKAVNDLNSRQTESRIKRLYFISMYFCWFTCSLSSSLRLKNIYYCT